MARAKACAKTSIMVKSLKVLYIATATSKSLIHRPKQGHFKSTQLDTASLGLQGDTEVTMTCKQNFGHLTTTELIWCFGFWGVDSVRILKTITPLM